MRTLATAIGKKSVLGKHTYDDILAVIAWGLQHLGSGKRATCRHDGSAWLHSDSKRAKLAANTPDFGFKAALGEVRGDWKFYKEVFNFPGWNTLEGICWLCYCKPDDLRDVGSDARWRANRVDLWTLLRKLRANNINPSPLFDVPWVTNAIFRMDWLHCVDQGIAADFLGNVLFILAKKEFQAGHSKRRWTPFGC